MESVNGLGALGLGIIVGNAGDIGSYPNPAKLWKRFCVGLVQHPDGTWHAQRSHRDKALAEIHAYNRRRRGELHKITDSLLRTNDDGYKALYHERRKHTAETHPDWTKMHSHKDAQRIVGKRMLRDLWRAWRAAHGRRTHKEG